MYRIKPKYNSNIIIKDINVTLRSNSDNWVYIDKEEFENSKDVKSIKSLIIAEECKEEIEVDKFNKNVENRVLELNNGVFVSKGEIRENPKNVFVKKQEDIIDEEISVKKKIVEEKPVKEKSVKEKIVEEKIVEEKPVKEKIIEEKPVKEKIIEEKPVKEKIVEEKSAKEKSIKEKVSKEKIVDQKKSNKKKS